jgi:hypothetical protein
MISLRKFTIAAAISTCGVVGCAQAPVDAHHSDAAGSTEGQAMPMGSAGDGMARMDEYMKAMHEMHDRMRGAKTPEERNTLMAEHMKLMRDGMAMMGGMGPGATSGDMATRQQMMEKRMEMMQSMMQMMMDCVPQAPAKSEGAR